MKKILYVEDDTINALILKKLLGKKYEITVAIDTTTCLEIIKKEIFDLILMDINLGNERMEGLELMKRIKQIPQYSDIKIVAVTGLSLAEEQTQLLKEGFDAFLLKPVDEFTLKDTVQNLLNDVS